MSSAAHLSLVFIQVSHSVPVQPVTHSHIPAVNSPLTQGNGWGLVVSAWRGAGTVTCPTTLVRTTPISRRAPWDQQHASGDILDTGTI